MPVAHPHQAAGVEGRHPRAQTGAAGRAVEAPRRDHDRVSAHLADALPRPGDLHDADAGDLGIVRVDALELLAGGDPDALAGERQVAGLARLDRKPERVGVGDRVPHAAVADIDRDRAQAVDLDRRVQAAGEAGHVGQLDALAAAVPALRPHLDHAPGGLEAERRFGLAHLDHARLEQHGRRADRVRARHRRVLGRLHDDEPGVAVGPRRRHDQVRVAGDAPARLVQQQLPQPVAVAPQRLHLLEHGRARRGQHAARDDVSDLAAGVAAHHRDHPSGPHAGEHTEGVGCGRACPAARERPADRPRAGCRRPRRGRGADRGRARAVAALDGPRVRAAGRAAPAAVRRARRGAARVGPPGRPGRAGAFARPVRPAAVVAGAGPAVPAGGGPVLGRRPVAPPPGSRVRGRGRPDRACVRRAAPGARRGHHRARERRLDRRHAPAGDADRGEPRARAGLVPGGGQSSMPALARFRDPLIQGRATDATIRACRVCDPVPGRELRELEGRVRQARAAEDPARRGRPLDRPLDRRSQRVHRRGRVHVGRRCPGVRAPTPTGWTSRTRSCSRAARTRRPGKRASTRPSTR